MALPTYTPNGSHQYNYAINGEPWLAATSNDNPYVRATAQVAKNQFDTSKDITESSLQNWWYRGQSSFDLGAGNRFFDVTDETLTRRFFDSHGVDALSTIGEITLQRKAQRSYNSTNTNLKTVGYANAGEQGVLMADGNVLRKITSAGTATTVTWGGSGQILDLDTNGSSYFVLSTDGIYGGALPGSTGSLLYRTTSTSGQITWSKERIVAALDKHIITVAPVQQAQYTTTNIVGSAGKITYTFTAIQGWEVGQLVTVSGSNIAGYNVSDAVITSVATNGLSFTVAGTATGTHSGTATVTNLPTPLFTNNTLGWVWTAIADGPSGIYFSGYVGDKSYIYYSTLGSDGLNLTSPSIVAEIPHGEVCYSMITYIGTYIVIGTNLGVRVGFMTSDGTLALGPLTIETNNNVKALYARGDYVWVGGAHSGFVVNPDNSITAGKTGIYRINVFKVASQTGTIFPFQKDIYADDITFLATEDVTSITNIGMTGRMAFTVAGKGLVYEAATERVATGWLETGKVRYDTSEDKIFQYLKVTNLVQGGTINVQWRNEANVIATTPLASWDTGTVRIANMDGSDGLAHPWVSYRFNFTRSTTNTAVAPVMLSYQIKAQPSIVKQRLIQLNLLCFASEKPVKGLEVKRSVYDRIKALEEAEEKGAVIVFQDLGTGEERLCLIENLEFQSKNIGDRTAAANPGGILKVTLRTVDITENVGA